MSDFAAAQAGLVAARGAEADARGAARQSVETQRVLAAEQARLVASSDPQHRDEQAAALERELREAAANARAQSDC